MLSRKPSAADENMRILNRKKTRHPLQVLVVLGIFFLLATVLVQSASAAQSPIPAAKQTVTTWVLNVYSGSPQACAQFDGKGQKQFLAIVREIWASDNFKQLVAQGLKTNPQFLHAAAVAVPDCPVAVPIFSKILTNSKTSTPLATVLASVKKAKGKEINGRTVSLFLAGNSKPTVIVLVRGHWLIDSIG